MFSPAPRSGLAVAPVPAPRGARRRLASQLGVSMAEVVVVVAIIGILASMAVPSFLEFTRSQRIRAAASDLHISLMRARSEAIKRNANVSIRPTSTSNWGLGWSIPDPEGSTTVLDKWSSYAGVSATGPTVVTYVSSGRIGGATPPSFEVSATGSSVKRCVSVDLSGRPTTTATAC